MFDENVQVWYITRPALFVLFLFFLVCVLESAELAALSSVFQKKQQETPNFPSYF